MTQDEIYLALNEVFCDVFDNEDIKLTQGTTAADIAGWDSLTHIGLVVAVENRFDVKFAMGDVVNMQNVGDMVTLILQEI